MEKIVPAILSNDPTEAKELVYACEGVVERVLIDIVDGKYVDNKTVDPSVFNDLDIAVKPGFQLMVEEPINWVEKCVRANADRIIGHIRMMDSQEKFVGKVQEVGRKVGLAVDLEMDYRIIEEVVLPSLDVVLVMSIPAGFGGQKFDSRALEKIKKLSNLREGDTRPFKIMVDGGITLENVKSVFDVGADEVSIGRRLFKGNLKDNFNEFLKRINS